MLAIAAAILFVIAWIIRATATAASPAFAPLSLVIIGLALLALYVAGLGPPLWPSGRPRWTTGRARRR